MILIADAVNEVIAPLDFQSRLRKDRDAAERRKVILDRNASAKGVILRVIKGLQKWNFLRLDA